MKDCSKGGGEAKVHPVRLSLSAFPEQLDVADVNAPDLSEESILSERGRSSTNSSSSSTSAPHRDDNFYFNETLMASSRLIIEASTKPDFEIHRNEIVEKVEGLHRLLEGLVNRDSKMTSSSLGRRKSSQYSRKRTQATFLRRPSHVDSVQSVIRQCFLIFKNLDDPRWSKDDQEIFLRRSGKTVDIIHCADKNWVVRYASFSEACNARLFFDKMSILRKKRLKVSELTQSEYLKHVCGIDNDTLDPIDDSLLKLLSVIKPLLKVYVLYAIPMTLLPLKGNAPVSKKAKRFVLHAAYPTFAIIVQLTHFALSCWRSSQAETLGEKITTLAVAWFTLTMVCVRLATAKEFLRPIEDSSLAKAMPLCVRNADDKEYVQYVVDRLCSYSLRSVILVTIGITLLLNFAHDWTLTALETCISLFSLFFVVATGNVTLTRITLKSRMVDMMFRTQIKDLVLDLKPFATSRYHILSLLKLCRTFALRETMTFQFMLLTLIGCSAIPLTSVFVLMDAITGETLIHLLVTFCVTIAMCIWVFYCFQNIQVSYVAADDISAALLTMRRAKVDNALVDQNVNSLIESMKSPEFDMYVPLFGYKLNGNFGVKMLRIYAYLMMILLARLATMWIAPA